MVTMFGRPSRPGTPGYKDERPSSIYSIIQQIRLYNTHRDNSNKDLILPLQTNIIVFHTLANMKSVAAFSMLAASAMALPTAAPAASSTASPYFGVMSSRSASPIHLLPLQANGGKFYLGGTNSAYCPADSIGADVCAQYPGNSTTLAGGSGTLSLGVVVPGGQEGTS